MATDRVVGTSRRRALPAGRAVVGGFLVAAAAVIVFAATLAGSSNRGSPWVVAARPLAAGSLLGPGDLVTETMRLPAGTSSLAFGQVSAVEGHTLSVALQPGELVQASMLAPAGATSDIRPVTIAVDSVSAAALTPGEPVDVLATSGSGSGVSVVARGATLIDLGKNSSGLLSQGSTLPATLGVATLAEVEAIVGAAHSGTITLVAAEKSDGIGSGSGP